MDREKYYETLYNKLNGGRGDELRVLGEICTDLAEISYALMRLRVRFKEIDRQVAECAETMGEPREAD